MANTILKHMGKNVGKSICENGSGSLVKEIFENPKFFKDRAHAPIFSPS